MSKKIEGKYPLTHFPHNKELTTEERERASKKAYDNFVEKNKERITFKNGGYIESVSDKPRSKNVVIGRKSGMYACCDICGEIFDCSAHGCGATPVKNAKAGMLWVCKKCNTPPLSDNLVKLTAEDYGIND